MKTTKHPLLDLIINEDGSQMWYQGKEIEVKSYKNDRDNYPFKRAAFANRTHSVAKLVCEAWNGLREEMNQVVHRKDKNPLNDHYTNLYWSKRGNIHTARTNWDYRSKVKPAEIPTVVKRLESGETLNRIARSYSTSDMAIHRIKKRWMLDRTLKLKQAVREAKTAHERKTAYANYMGYKTVADAIAEHGAHIFNKKADELSMKI